MRRPIVWVAWLVLGMGPSSAWAHAPFELVTTGPGFDDATPRAPIGGNTGTTVGEQRLRVVERAVATWSQALESAATTTVEVAFEDMGCGGGAPVLGRGRPESMLVGVQAPGVSSSTWYPAALANHLSGQDLTGEDPEVVVSFNAAVDDCGGEVQPWYYGLDGKSGEQADLLDTALHELAHGLGFHTLVDLSTGEDGLPEGESDVFAQHVLDLDAELTWGAMTPAQRLQSGRRVRRLVWTGAYAQQAAASHLASGTPELEVSPRPNGFEGHPSELRFAPAFGDQPISAPLVLADPLDGCTNLKNDVAGRVVLFNPACVLNQVAQHAADGGALAVLMRLQASWEAPARVWDTALSPPVSLPVVSISDSDYRVLTDALKGEALSATVRGDNGRLLGADAEGRVLIFTSRPALSGTGITHVDPSARPQLLMEPNERSEDPLQIDVSLAMLQDLGWAPRCGNGVQDGEEACDQGSANSNTAPDTCRSDCSLPRCGDGVVDTGEACDDGPLGTCTDNTCVPLPGTVPLEGGAEDAEPDAAPSERGSGCALGAPTRVGRWLAVCFLCLGLCWCRRRIPKRHPAGRLH